MTDEICKNYNLELRAVRRENRVMFGLCLVLLGFKTVQTLF